MGQRVIVLRLLVISGLVALVSGCATTPESTAPVQPGSGTRNTSTSASGAVGGTGGTSMPALTPEQKQQSDTMSKAYSQNYANAAAARQGQFRR